MTAVMFWPAEPESFTRCWADRHPGRYANGGVGEACEQPAVSDIGLCARHQREIFGEP
jgi:hypothetical protein